MATENLGAILPVSDNDAWKVVTYNGAFGVLDRAIAGYLLLSVAGNADVLLDNQASPVPGVQALHKAYEFAGALTGSISVKFPATGGSSALFIVFNNTTGAHTLTVKTTAGGSTGIVVTQGQKRLLWTDGTNVYDAVTEAGGVAVPTGAWAAWTPTWTNVTVGDGTVVALYQQIGKTVFCRISLILGSTSAISGNIIFTLPVNRAAIAGTASMTPIGNASGFDSSAATAYRGSVTPNASVSQAQIAFLNASATYLTSALASATIPFTWAISDEIAGQFYYEAA